MTNQECANISLELNGNKINWVDNFKYLGSMVVSSETDIKLRKGQAWGAFWKLKNIFKSKTLTKEIKISIFKTAVLAVLLYGCESWIITKQLEQSLNSFATNCYRIMLNVKKSERKSNDQILKEVKMDNLALIIQRRQLTYVGHCLRKHNNEIKPELIHDYVLYKPNESE